jgi:hypothetical protein
MIERDINETIGREITRLARGRFGSVFSGRSDVMRRMLRIEIDDERFDQLMCDASSGLRFEYMANREAQGPMQIQGVDLYVISRPRTLSEPGWFVINPLGDRR